MNTCSHLRRAAIAIALSACAAAPALAKDSGFYLGMDVGRSMYDVEIETTGRFTTTTGPRTDDDDLAYTVDFGYRINPYISVELSFADFGKYSVTEFGSVNVTVPTAVPNPTRPALGNAEVRGSAEGISLAAIGTLPVQNWEFSAKLGILATKTTLEQSAYTSTPDSAATCNPVASTPGTNSVGCTWALPNSGNFANSENTTEVLFGVGVGRNLSEEFLLKLEYTMLSSVGDKDKTFENDLSYISLGFQYRF